MNPILRFKHSSVGALALMLVACASNEVRVDQAEQGALAACKTVDWLNAAEVPQSLTEQRVRDEVFRQLEDKGYSRVTDSPDCKLAFIFDSHERASGKPRVGVGVGGGSGGLGGGIGVSIPVPGGKKNTGQFSLAVINTATNAEIWNGSVDVASKEPELTQEEAAEAVSAVLAKVPNRG